MGVTETNPSSGGSAQPPSQRRKRVLEEDIFQQTVGTEASSVAPKKIHRTVRAAPTAALSSEEHAFCQAFSRALSNGTSLELQSLASDPRVSKVVAMHLLQAKGIDRAGDPVLERLVTAAGGDPHRIVRHIAKWAEASPAVFRALIMMGPPSAQKDVAREVLSCLGQRGDMATVMPVFRALPASLRPKLEEIEARLSEIKQLREQLGGLHLGLPDRGGILWP
jgi:hypothetical protein